MSPPCATAQPSLPRPAECPARTRNCSESEQEAASCGFAPIPKSGFANCRGWGACRNLLEQGSPPRNWALSHTSSPHFQGGWKAQQLRRPEEGRAVSCRAGRDQVLEAQLDPGLLLKSPKGGSCTRGQATSSGGLHAAAAPATPAGPGSGKSRSLCHRLGHGSASQLPNSLAQLEHGRTALPGVPGCSGCLGCHARIAFHHVSLERRRRRRRKWGGDSAQRQQDKGHQAREPAMARTLGSMDGWALRALALGHFPSHAMSPELGPFCGLWLQIPALGHSSQSSAPLPQGHANERAGYPLPSSSSASPRPQAALTALLQGIPAA